MYRAVRSATSAFLRGPIRHIVGPIITPLDRALFHVSGGRLKLSAPLVPSLMLYSTGAQSGLRRETPLMCFPRPGGVWYIVGSNFGLERHPAWSGNLIANPDAEIHYRGRLLPVRATLLSHAEADTLWPELEVQWPHYREYEKTARREIRIFRLDSR